jgi:hypothetical protein
MPLQRFTMSRMPSFAKVSQGSHSTTAPLAPCEPGWVTTPISHSSKQGTLPIVPQISRQAIQYRTRGCTLCPGMSTPKTQSLSDWSMTNHITWRNPTVTTIPTLLKPWHWSLPRSPHIMTDGRPKLSTITQAKLNIIKMERLVRHSWLHG